MAGTYRSGLENDLAHIPPGSDDGRAGVDNSLYLGFNYTSNETALW
ncbi:hypothetical protein AB4305_11330 [Nocardia sp. 2YAB30]